MLQLMESEFNKNLIVKEDFYLPQVQLYLF